MNKPLIVGEDNPFDSDPRYALFPYSLASSGGRLCAILGLCEARYLRDFDRTNLCRRTWNLTEARASARRILRQRRRVLILLGEKVATASTWAVQKQRAPKSQARHDAASIPSSRFRPLA